MKETSFIKKYKDRWQELENYLKRSEKTDPDYLSTLYVQLTDDLSYAKTHYPDSKLTLYLNQLSSKIHAELYKNKKEKANRFVNFWVTELPMTIYKHRRVVLISFIGLLLSFSIGWISNQNDNSFIRMVIGDRYVDETEARIEAGDPLGVYAEEGMINMFFYITKNNIQVSVVFFVLGIFLGIGTLYVLVKNGIILGAFFSMFYLWSLKEGYEGVIGTAMSTVWMHGTIEITEMVFSGAAGMVLGGSIIFTGTYSRMESIKRGAKDGLKILFGMMPFIVVAGFIESFLTRFHDVLLLSYTIIILSLGVVLSYLVIYPFYVGKKARLSSPEGSEMEGSFMKGPTNYQWDFVTGIILLIAGIIPTIVTFSMNTGAGILWYGAIISGIIKILIGFRKRSREKSLIQVKEDHGTT